MDPRNTQVTSEELDKSLERLEEFAASGDAVSRKDALLQKAASQDLEKSERDELFSLLGGAERAPVAPTVAEDLVKSFGDEAGEGLQEALDVSPYLRDQHTALIKSLELVGEQLEKSDRRSYEQNVMLSRAVVEMGGLVKSMSERLEVIESQPVRGPKSRGAAQVLSKSFGDGDDDGGGGGEISKGQIDDALTEMLQKSMDAGHEGRSPKGVDLLLESAKFEQSRRISPLALAEVKAHIAGKTAAH